MVPIRRDVDGLFIETLPIKYESRDGSIYVFFDQRDRDHAEYIFMHAHEFAGLAGTSYATLLEAKTNFTVNILSEQTFSQTSGLHSAASLVDASILKSVACILETS